MIATIVNCAAVLLGSFIGILFGKQVKEPQKEILFVSAGLVSLIIGIKMSLESNHVLFIMISLVLGGLAGHALGIENGILRFGTFLQSRFRTGKDSKNFAFGFLNASVLFCVGAMAIVGSFNAGARGDYEVLFTKSVMDGFMAIALTAAMGIGVAFSALSIFVYQGALTLLGAVAVNYLSSAAMTELTGCGGALVIMIGLNLLGIKQIKTANFLPALVVVLLLSLGEPLFL
ncbi:MAG TPA: DUF554 domain-containing protein [Spirochaetia bacterium]|nr:DUF554 domain-containing protein [Spirochaetia bacterium]